MNYEQTVEYLYAQLPVFQKTGGSAYKEGLDNSLQLDDLLGHPHRKYKTIHVAGTNGKGSVSHLSAAILQESGYKTGLYTSPHLIDFRERIRVNGQMIDKDYIVDFTEKMKPAVSDIRPSFFELTMMMAFSYFAEMNVEVAVIETGLGGRLDSTNIIRPDLSVITNISLDHTQFLGRTLPEIAGEKAGIIKPDIPVIIGEAKNMEVRKVFEKKAEEVKTRIFFAEDKKPIQETGFKDGYQIFQTENYPDLACELTGFYQQENAGTVLTIVNLLKELNYRIPDHAVYSGFKNVRSLTGLSGRWQILHTDPKIICDTGHNEAGISRIIEQLKTEKYKVLRIVFGMVNDKDISNVMALLPKDAVYYFTKASVPRALDEKELQLKAAPENLKGKTYPSVKEAVDAAKFDAAKNDLIFIGGSTFIVANALCLFND
jgi:dihydrofolate synthase/folylpolyglutamate synthase